MAQRGRKSAVALSAVSTIPGQRPPPPAELTPEQAAEWRAIVSTKPADWFARDCWPILADMCRHTVIARRISEQIDGFPLDMLSGEEGLERYRKLGAMLERHSRTVGLLATRLRCTPQSRYGARAADTAARRGDANGANRPWDC